MTGSYLTTRYAPSPLPGMDTPTPTHTQTPLAHALLFITTIFNQPFPRASRSPASHLRQLFHHNGISAIVSSLKTAIEEMPQNCHSLQESFGEEMERIM
jgi:hypothetical protein